MRLIGVEAGGHGIMPGEHAARFAGGSSGVLQGTKTYVLQDENGNIELTHSISAGLDYAAVGPEHAWLHDSRRAEYAWIGDDDAFAAFQRLAREEGIIPALESAHAVAHAIRIAPWLGADEVVLVNLSGRGDKDVMSVQKRLPRRGTLRREGRGALMSRLARTFARLRANGRGGLVTYLTAGDPDADRSVALLVAVARAGADVLEVGVPFSDPLADGPVIQRASERALAGGMSLRGALDVVRRVRAEVDTPIVLFTYANPVVRMDPTVFARTAADAGVDGVLILDYPVEEAEPLRAPLLDAGLDPIFLISPTTSEERIREVGRARRRVPVCDLPPRRHRRAGQAARGRRQPDGARARLRRSARWRSGSASRIPTRSSDACRVADAAVVGSALVNVVAEHAASANECEHASEYVRWLKNSL